MTLVYYNQKADCIFLIESEDDPGLSLLYVLCYSKKNKKHGWIFLGDL